MRKSSKDKSHNKIVTSLGERIKALRLEREMTQMDLAVIINIEPSTIRRYEKGKVEMRFTMLIEFAKAFDVSVDELLSFEN